MKWILFMTLVTRWGSSLDHVELNREDDCWRAASSWVAAQHHRHIATAICVQRDAPAKLPQEKLK